MPVGSGTRISLVLLLRMISPLLCMLVVSGPASADHKPDAVWSWHILSTGISESRMSIYRRDELLGIFDFSCDLTELDDDDSGDNGNTIQLVRIDTHPRGLLLLRCNLGAHSQMLSIIDLAQKASEPAFSRTGSFFAAWEIQDGELWISYDQPCDGGRSVDCPDGFETIFVQFPETGISEKRESDW